MIDSAILIMRVWLGVVMVAHGVNHARSLDGTTRWFASTGFSRPRVLALASAFGELAIGVGLAVGLLTSFAAAGLIATMVLAFWTIHRFAGFFVFHRPDEGYEYVGTLMAAGLALVMIGPGRYSLDELLGWADTLNGWPGLAIAAGGVGLAVILLAALWSRPDQDQA